jgi:hypothetical protein
MTDDSSIVKLLAVIVDGFLFVGKDLCAHKSDCAIFKAELKRHFFGLLEVQGGKEMNFGRFDTFFVVF